MSQLYQCLYERRSVDRLTKTQIILNDGRRFYRKDGWMVGNSYRWQIVAETSEISDELCRRELIASINDFIDIRKNQNRFTIDELCRIAEIVNSAKSREEA